MSKRIQTELRTYMSYLDTQVAPITIDETIEPGFATESVGPIALQPQSADLRPRRPWLIAATSAAVLLLVGGVMWLTQATGSDTPVADTVVAMTPAATDTTAQGKNAAASVFGHLEDAGYWQGPLCGTQPCIGEGRMVMSDERLSGNVTLTYNGEIIVEETTSLEGSYLYWGTMLVENDGGTWEGTHFAADHHSRGPEAHGSVVMQLVGSGDYAGLSAILYRTVISPPGTALIDLEQSVDGIIFRGDLPPERT